MGKCEIFFLDNSLEATDVPYWWEHWVYFTAQPGSEDPYAAVMCGTEGFNAFAEFILPVKPFHACRTCFVPPCNTTQLQHKMCLCRFNVYLMCNMFTAL